MVASLTLRLQDQMSGGVGEIQSLFTNLTTTLGTLNDTLGSMQDLLANLRGPANLMSDLDAVNAQVKVSADTMAASMDEVSTGVDANIVKIKEMYAAMGQGMSFMPPGSQVGGGFNPDAMLPPGSARPGDEPAPEDEPRPGGQGLGTAGDAMGHILMAGIGVAIARNAAEKYADFGQILYQTAIKEGLNGGPAADEIARLNTMLDGLAVKTANSSTALAEAYYYLTIHGMAPGVISAMMPALARDATAYGNDPIEDAKSVSALNQVLGIAPDQMQRGLSIISDASSLGGFSVGDFGSYIQGFSAKLALMKNGGIGGLVSVASAVEATHKDFSDSADDATAMQDLLSYLSSPIAARFFARTKRSMDLLAPSQRALFDKYHIGGIDIPKYLDSREALGEGAFDAEMDLARLVNTKLPTNITGTDKLEIFGALFHNTEAAKAAMAIAENFDVFKANETTLYGIGPGKVQTDFQTSLNSPKSQMNIVDEKFAELTRSLGVNVIPSLTLLGTGANVALEGLNKIGDFWNSLAVGIGTGAVYAMHPGAKQPNAGFLGARDGPIHIHVNVDKSGNVRVTQGPSSSAGSRGQVLSRH